MEQDTSEENYIIIPSILGIHSRIEDHIEAPVSRRIRLNRRSILIEPTSVDELAENLDIGFIYGTNQSEEIRQIMDAESELLDSLDYGFIEDILDENVPLGRMVEEFAFYEQWFQTVSANIQAYRQEFMQDRIDAQ